MASSKEYLEFILGQLSELEEITYRAMMGEFIIYYRGKIVGGIYDDKTVMEELYKWSELECLRKHVKFRLFKVYGIAELSQDGIEESDIDAELYFAFCKAVERYQLHDDLPETEEEKMFITYCHRYMDGDVKRFIEKENRISHYYTWLLMRIKANGYDVFSNTEECIEIIRDNREVETTLSRLLVKPVKSAISCMPTAPYELPYEGAKEMLLVDEVDNKEFLTGLFHAMYDELPAPKPKKKKQTTSSLSDSRAI